MNIHSYIYDVNKSNIKIKFQRWVDLKQYYLSMYRFYLLKLYDMGYSSDPIVYKEEEILLSFMDLGILEDLEDDAGTIHLDSIRCEYCYKKNLNISNQEIKDFLFVVYNVLKYREYCLELDKQFELNQSYFKFFFMLKYHSLVSSLCVISYNKGVFSILCPDGYCLREYSLNNFIYSLALDDLGLEDRDSCFINGLSKEDHANFVRLILSGQLCINGINASVLKDKISECNGNYYEYLCTKYSEDILNETSRLAELAGDDLIAIYEERIYYKVPIEKYKLPAGLFILYVNDEGNDYLEDIYSSTSGYSGECYSEKFLESEGFDYIGIPILVTIQGHDVFAYDYNQIVSMVDMDTWFKESNNTFEFEESFDLENPYEEGTVEFEIFKSFICSMRGILYEMPASLVSYKDFKAVKKKVNSKIAKILSNER